MSGGRVRPRGGGDPLRYAASLPFRGRADEAFGLAEAALTALGFRLADKSADAREWVGPGMNSSR